MLNVLNASTVIICEHNFQTAKYFCFILSTGTNDQVPKADMNSHLKSYPLFFLHSCSVSCQQHLCVCTWRLKFLVRGLSNLLNESQLGPSPPHSSSPAALCFFLIAIVLRSFPFHVPSLSLHLTLSRSKLYTLISIFSLKMLVEKRRYWRPAAAEVGVSR